MRISTNLNSLRSQRYLDKVRSSREDDSFRLSSGDRIVRAAMDPAGLAISEKLRATLRGRQQALRNTNDGISLVQVTEGTLGVVHDLGQRLRELAMQSANGSLGDSERDLIDIEFQGLKNEISRLSKSTRFNGKLVLRGDGSEYDLQVGVNNKENEDRIVYKMKNVLSSLEKLQIDGARVNSASSARTALGQVDTMISKVSQSRASLGSMANRLVEAAENTRIMTVNESAGKSRIRDADVAYEKTNEVNNGIREKAAAASLQLSNSSPENILKLVS